jgi:hypothetical protein
MQKKTIFAGAVVLGSIALARRRAADRPLSAREARAIAKDAYVYGFPMIDSYRIQHAYFADRGGPEYKTEWNRIYNNARVYTPDDKAVQTPNSDTPYSYVGADLRAEPLVLTVPEVESDRYYSLQFVDMYTFNFAYVGSRATGNGAGSYLLAGPHWQGEKPSGVKAVIRSETEFATVIYRTQLFNPQDIANVKKIQAGYKVQTLSEFLGRVAPIALPVDFVKPLSASEERKSPEFFNVLNFILQFCPTHPSERSLMARFARLGIGSGKKFDAKALSPEIREAVENGMADALKTFDDFKAKKLEPRKLSSGDIVGSRAYLRNNYLYRMAAAVLGIYGNSKEEALYPVYWLDSAGKKLDGRGNRYALRFQSVQLPPVNAFWSLTLYELPASLLYANKLNRYLINSPMLPDLKKDFDGGITLYVQNESPGAEKESNWLPAPKGPFMTALRLYWPKAEALTGKWKQPPLERVS